MPIGKLNVQKDQVDFAVVLRQKSNGLRNSSVAVLSGLAVP
ncbi:hypothetical protein [Siphonobacter sp. SORGH_AS_0500]|nr:hypothetical protein [Siphonobacter sp. SORGH_AS_0500]MDR6195819.1 hypothetical protein [Siphonobacter sp. SORGH_AS_0500]